MEKNLSAKEKKYGRKIFFPPFFPPPQKGRSIRKEEPALDFHVTFFADQAIPGMVFSKKRNFRIETVVAIFFFVVLFFRLRADWIVSH